MDRHTRVTESTNIGMTNDAENPLYKFKKSRAAVTVTITPSPPLPHLSLEGVSPSPMTGKASEQPEAKSQTPPTAASNRMVVTMLYKFLTHMVGDQHQTRALLDQVIERLA